MGVHPCHFVGVSLGQSQQFTALAVLERFESKGADLRSQRRPPYTLRHLQRFPPATSYPVIVDDLRALLQALPPPGGVLTVDQTGVGRPVIDLLEDGLTDLVNCPLYRLITLTAGLHLA